MTGSQSFRSARRIENFAYSCENHLIAISLINHEINPCYLLHRLITGYHVSTNHSRAETFGAGGECRTLGVRHNPTFILIG